MQVFVEHAWHEDLTTLMQRVGQELKMICTSRGEKQSAECLLRGITKKIYFNPGLYQSDGTAAATQMAVALQRRQTCQKSNANSQPTMGLDDVWSAIGIDAADTDKYINTI